MVRDATAIPARFLPRVDFVRNLVVANGPVLQLFHGQGGPDEPFLRHLCRRGDQTSEWFLARVLRMDLLRLLANRLSLRTLLTERLSAGSGWHLSYERGELVGVKLALAPDEEFLPETDEPLGDLLEPQGAFTVFTGDDLEYADLFTHLRRVQALYCYVGMGADSWRSVVPSHPYRDGFSTLHLRGEVYEQADPEQQPKLLGFASNSPGYMRIRGDDEVVRKMVGVVNTVIRRRRAVSERENRLARYLSEQGLNDRESPPPTPDQQDMLELYGKGILDVLGAASWDWVAKHASSVFEAAKFTLIFCREAMRVADAAEDGSIELPLFVDEAASR